MDIHDDELRKFEADGAAPLPVPNDQGSIQHLRDLPVHSRLVRSPTGRRPERCNAAACWFMTAAAWVRRLPLGLLKSTVLTPYLQKEHLNAVPPFIGFVV